MKKLSIIFTAAFIFLLSAKSVSAQAISLSVSPPILEVMVAPGKTVSYDFVVSSLESNVVLVPQIVSFIPAGINGETEQSTMAPPSFISVNNQPFSLSPGASSPITLKIAPPPNSPEKDYYLRLVFETQDFPEISGQNVSSAKVRIASNILLTVSGNGLPNKNAKVLEFSAPRLTDSFFGITYTTKIVNNGSAFFKPVGKITVNPIIGPDVTLTLAPQNILSGSVRQIRCLDGETIIDCTLPGFFHFGIYKANLEFNLDDSAKVYSEGVTTIAFPFLLVFALFALFLMLKLGRMMVGKVAEGLEKIGEQAINIFTKAKRIFAKNK